LLLPLPTLLWIIAVANDRSDLFGFPGGPWFFAWLIGIAGAPAAYAPMAWAFALHQRRPPRWPTVAAICVIGAIINWLLGVTVVLTVYFTKY